MTLIDKYILHLNIYILFVMTLMSVVFYCHVEELFDSDVVRHLDRHSMELCFFVWLLLHLLSAGHAAYVRAYWESCKLDSIGAPVSQQGCSAGLAADSRYCILRGGSRVFFGRSVDEQAARQSEEEVTMWCGTWCSETFYGPHGIEYVWISVLRDEDGELQLMARKITGDRNVPCGRVTWQTKNGVPRIGGPRSPIKAQVRSDVDDPDGFEWCDHPGVTAISLNKLDLCQGTFYRLQPITIVGIPGKDDGAVDQTTSLLASESGS